VLAFGGAPTSRGACVSDVSVVVVHRLARERPVAPTTLHRERRATWQLMLAAAGVAAVPAEASWMNASWVVPLRSAWSGEAVRPR
jgi:hypothetical protein